MKATEQYLVLFILLYKVVLTFEYAGGTLKCDHSNESYWRIHYCGDSYITKMLSHMYTFYLFIYVLLKVSLSSQVTLCALMLLSDTVHTDSFTAHNNNNNNNNNNNIYEEEVTWNNI